MQTLAILCIVQITHHFFTYLLKTFCFDKLK